MSLACELPVPCDATDVKLKGVDVEVKEKPLLFCSAGAAAGGIPNTKLDALSG